MSHGHWCLGCLQSCLVLDSRGTENVDIYTWDKLKERRENPPTFHFVSSFEETAKVCCANWGGLCLRLFGIVAGDEKVGGDLRTTLDEQVLDWGGISFCQIIIFLAFSSPYFKSVPFLFLSIQLLVILFLSIQLLVNSHPEWRLAGLSLNCYLSQAIKLSP